MKKKLFYLLAFALLLISCQNENTNEPEQIETVVETITDYDQALLLIQDEDYLQAIQLLEDEEDTESRLALAKAYSAFGKYPQALEILKNSPDQEDIQVLNMYGHYYNDKAENLYTNSYYVILLTTDQAISHFQKVLDLDPYNQEALLGISRAYKLKIFEDDQALEYLKQAANINPSTQVNTMLLDAYLEEYKDDDFKTLIEALYANAPDNYTYAKYYGMSLENFGTEEQVISLYNQMDLDFPEEDCLTLLAKYYLESRLLDESLETITALEPLTQNEQIQILYLDILLASNKTDLLEEAIDYFMNQEQEYMAYYYKSQMAFTTFDFQGVIDNLALSIEHKPNRERHSLLLQNLMGRQDEMYQEVFLDYLSKYPLDSDNIKQARYLLESVDKPSELIEEIYQVMGSDELLVQAGAFAFQEDDYDFSLEILKQTINLDADENSDQEKVVYGINELLNGNVDIAKEYFDDVEYNMLSLYLALVETGSMPYTDYMNYVAILKDYQSQEKAIDKVKETMNQFPNSPYYILEVANMYEHFGDNFMAIHYINKAIDIDPNPLLKSVKLRYQYYFNRHMEAEITAMELIDDPEFRQDALYYLGSIYEDYLEIDKAIDYLETLIAESNNNESSFYVRMAHYKLARYYSVYKGDRETAQVHIDAYVSNKDFIDTDMAALQDYMNSVEEQKNDKEFIKDIFNNYLYSYKTDAFESFEDDLSDEEVKDFIDQLKDSKDIYTYVKFNDEKNSPFSNDQVNQENVVYKQLADQLHYIDINSFGNKVQYEAISYLDKIENKEASSLIIDLRDNTGGNIYAALDILDQFLGEQVIAKDVDKNGTDFKHYSDAFHYDFDHIYILTNNGTASASELVTLALSSHLENVRVLGGKTRGKGVAQQIFRQVDKGRTYFIVSFKWYVGDRNIQNVGLIPDHEMTDEQIQAYFQETYQVPSFE